MPVTSQKLTITLTGDEINFEFEPKLARESELLENEEKALQGMARVAAGAAHEALSKIVTDAQEAVRNQLEG